MSSPAGTKSFSHVFSLVRVVELGAHDNASSERNISVAWYLSRRHESETRNLAKGELASLSVQVVEPDPSATQCGVVSCCTARDCGGNLAMFPGHCGELQSWKDVGLSALAFAKDGARKPNRGVAEMECNKEMWICIILCQNTECRTQLCYKPSVVLSQHARICHVRLKDIAQG